WNNHSPKKLLRPSDRSKTQVSQNQKDQEQNTQERTSKQKHEAFRLYPLFLSALAVFSFSNDGVQAVSDNANEKALENANFCARKEWKFLKKVIDQEVTNLAVSTEAFAKVAKEELVVLTPLLGGIKDRVISLRTKSKAYEKGLSKKEMGCLNSVTKYQQLRKLVDRAVSSVDVLKGQARKLVRGALPTGHLDARKLTEDDLVVLIEKVYTDAVAFDRVIGSPEAFDWRDEVVAEHSGLNSQAVEALCEFRGIVKDLGNYLGKPAPAGSAPFSCD
ncbi:MAG: hypothetical protein SGARI_006732, partial [Bacillariaceae sp.]